MELNKDERRAVAKVNAELSMGSLNSGDYAAALTHIQRAVNFITANEPQAVPVTPNAIPPGVYWNASDTTFYGFDGVEKDSVFCCTWHPHRAEFPTAPGLII